MAQVSEIVIDLAPPLNGALHLNELMAHVYLGSGGNDEHMEGWYVGIGTSSHMMGRERVFLVLDHVVGGTMQFGDGSLVPI
jgi:hypothetical protein